MRLDFNFNTEQRCANGGTKEWFVTLIVGVGNERNACAKKFRARGLDVNRFAVISAHKRQAVICAGHFAIFKFSLSNCTTEVDIPQHWSFCLVGLVACKVAKERALGNATTPIIDGRVSERPVNRKSERAEELFKCLFIFSGERVAQLDEVAAADLRRKFLLIFLWTIRHRCRRCEVGVVRQRGIALHAVVVLHPAFGGQAVVVPSHWIEDRFATHALVAGDGVGVGVTEDVADMERAAHGRGRSIDRVHAISGGGAIEGIGAVGVPGRAPAGLEALEVGLLGNGPTASRSGGGRCHDPITLVRPACSTHVRTRRRGCGDR